jgi:hypothetical protein
LLKISGHSNFVKNIKAYTLQEDPDKNGPRQLFTSRQVANLYRVRGQNALKFKEKDPLP